MSVAALSAFGATTTKYSLPDDWTWVRLGDVCDPEIRTRDPQRTPSKAFRYVDITSVDNKAKRIKEPKNLIGAEAPSRARQIIRAHDVIVSTTRPNLNAVALVPDNLDGEICSTGFCVLRAVTAVLDHQYLFAFTQSEAFVGSISELVKGALYPAITDSQVRAQLIPLPPIQEQWRIAAVLTEQMAAVDLARVAAQAQLQAARELPAAYLRSVFDSDEARNWPTEPLGEVCDLLPSKSIVTSGDSTVRAITTACLTEGGFNRDGLKTAKMRSVDVAGCLVSAGEILVARSNTTELVGRCAMVPNGLGDVIASDLTIRIRLVAPEMSSSFLTSFLSYLYLRGYWWERAGGASDSMKKITRSQIRSLRIPVAPVQVQHRIVTRLNAQMTAAAMARAALETQLDAIHKLPAVLLRQAFSGELSRDRSMAARTADFRQDVPAPVAISSYIVRRLEDRNTFGRVALQKTLFLVETHLGKSLGGQYRRAAAGPYNHQFREPLEREAAESGWFQTHRRDGRYYFTPGPNIEHSIAKATTLLGDQKQEMDRLLDLLHNVRTRRVEARTTLFAAWNDFLLDGDKPDDTQIIEEVLEHWHPEKKKKFTRDELREDLAWLRTHGIVPCGVGPHTTGDPSDENEQEDDEEWD